MKCKHGKIKDDEHPCKRPPVESLSDYERKRFIELGFIKNGEYVSEEDEG